MTVFLTKLPYSAGVGGRQSEGLAEAGEEDTGEMRELFLVDKLRQVGEDRIDFDWWQWRERCWGD